MRSITTVTTTTDIYSWLLRRIHVIQAVVSLAQSLNLDTVAIGCVYFVLCRTNSIMKVLVEVIALYHDGRGCSRIVGVGIAFCTFDVILLFDWRRTLIGRIICSCLILSIGIRILLSAAVFR